MKRTIQTLTAMTVVAVALAFSPTQASAANPQAYREAMREFTPVIERWAAEARVTIDGAVIKPELACEASTRELTFRGQSILADLAGTAASAPRAVRFSHDAATAAFGRMVEQTAVACGAESEAAVAFEASFRAFGAPIKVVRLYAAR